MAVADNSLLVVFWSSLSSLPKVPLHPTAQTIRFNLDLSGTQDPELCARERAGMSRMLFKENSSAIAPGTCALIWQLLQQPKRWSAAGDTVLPCTDTISPNCTESSGLSHLTLDGCLHLKECEKLNLQSHLFWGMAELNILKNCRRRGALHFSAPHWCPNQLMGESWSLLHASPMPSPASTPETQ